MAASAAVLMLVGYVSIGGSGHAAPSATRLSHEKIAQLLLDHGRSRFASLGAQRGLQYAAGRGLQSPGRTAGEDRRLTNTRRAGGTPAAITRAGLVNVRVNSPRLDTHQTDQTTQSETSMTVSGAHVAVGYNDSQQALLALTDGLDFNGYAYSSDGGKSFTDGGTVPNPLNFVNLGDPWLASDRDGRMFYGSLTFGGDVGNTEIGVARSDNGGKTWQTPILTSPNNSNVFYSADKDAIVTGRDPSVASRDNIYAAWDDFYVDPSSGSGFNGLPVSTSKDRGKTWSLHYADKITSDIKSCSFGQYIGAQPLVDPANGTLYVAAEKIQVDDPNCTFTATPTRSEVIFRSNDAGQTFSRGFTVSSVTAATPTGALELGPGQLVRTIEFPTLALNGKTLSLAWNDGRSGRSHILLATSTNRGSTWTLGAATSGGGDEVQPAMVSDSAGLHLSYYQRNADNTLDTVVADSTDSGIHFTSKAVTSRSFEGVHTVPQFDPQIAFGYMGDYIALASDGTHQYFAWGDNRDRVTNFTHPAGRNDPDVFFARR